MILYSYTDELGESNLSPSRELLTNAFNNLKGAGTVASTTSPRATGILADHAFNIVTKYVHATFGLLERSATNEFFTVSVSDHCDILSCTSWVQLRFTDSLSKGTYQQVLKYVPGAEMFLMSTIEDMTRDFLCNAYQNILHTFADALEDCKTDEYRTIYYDKYDEDSKHSEYNDPLRVAVDILVSMHSHDIVMAQAGDWDTLLLNYHGLCRVLPISYEDAYAYLGRDTSGLTFKDKVDIMYDYLLMTIQQKFESVLSEAYPPEFYKYLSKYYAKTKEEDIDD